MTSGIGAIDLFCGLGGMTSGLLSAGVDVALGVDTLSDLEFPYTANNPVPFRLESRGLKTLDFCFPAYEPFELTLAAISPPCHRFDHIRTKRSYGNNSMMRFLNGLVFRLIDMVAPDFIVMDSPPGTLLWKHHENLFSELKAFGYSVCSRTVNLKDLGVPQSKSRFLMLAARNRRARFAPIEEIEPRTVRQTIGFLPRLKAGGRSKKYPLHKATSMKPLSLERIRASIPGGTFEDWPKELIPSSLLKLRERPEFYYNAYGRMEWDKPAPSITSYYVDFVCGRFGHPSQDRGLSYYEGLLLQGFPRGYKILPDKGDPYKRTPTGLPLYPYVDQGSVKAKAPTRIHAGYIANSVPPQVGEYLGRCVLGLV